MTQLAVLDRYQRRFGQQEPRDQRPVEVIARPEIQEIFSVYSNWLFRGKFGYPEDYKFILQNLGERNYSAKDIRDFSTAIKIYEDEDDFRWSGLFITALIEKSPESDFEVVTEHLEKPLSHLGIENTKRITVFGNSGDFVGCDQRGTIIVRGDAGEHAGNGQRSGSIIIYGNAGQSLGCEMVKGSILVYGNAGDRVGLLMENGSIKVRGDADGEVGLHMSGGFIKIHGDAKGFVGGGMTGGKIRVEGKLQALSSDVGKGRIYHCGELVAGKV